MSKENKPNPESDITEKATALYSHISVVWNLSYLSALGVIHVLYPLISLRSSDVTKSCLYKDKTYKCFTKSKHGIQVIFLLAITSVF